MVPVSTAVGAKDMVEDNGAELGLTQTRRSCWRVAAALGATPWKSLLGDIAAVPLG